MTQLRPPPVTGQPAAARPDAIRRHNLALVLDHVHRDGALTRAELTQRLGVSRSTVGALVADLIQLGLVAEVVPNGGTSGSNGAGVGRPSHLVAPHHRGPYVLAVDVDVTRIVTAAVGIGGDMLARDVVVTGARLGSPAQVAAAIAGAVQRVIAATGRSGSPLSLGISVPGTVNRVTGRVGVAPNLDWQDVGLVDLLADALPSGMGAVLGNDADLAVLAEHTRGNARGFDDVVYLIGRVGVGAGIIVNGVPLRGYAGHAGEIGHNVIDGGGPLCHCGKHGCVETYLGEAALLAAAGRRGPVPSDAVRAVFESARIGDAAAVAAVHAVAEQLGRPSPSRTLTALTGAL